MVSTSRGGSVRSLPRRVGPDGSVAGVDASREMIAVAQSKAARRKAPVRFQVAAAQQLPFPNGSFDAVVTSLMIHHRR